ASSPRTRLRSSTTNTSALGFTTWSRQTLRSAFGSAGDLMTKLPASSATSGSVCGFDDSRREDDFRPAKIWQQPLNAFSFIDAESTFCFLQLLSVRGPDVLRCQVNLDFLERPAESKRCLVGVAHRRPGVLSRVERLVRREPAEDCLLNTAHPYLLTVD